MATALSPVASHGKANAATESFASQDPIRMDLEVNLSPLTLRPLPYTGQPLSPLKPGADQAAEAVSAERAGQTAWE